MDGLDLLQWPAMVVTVVATWLVGCKRSGRRRAGFWLFLISNALWITWGHTPKLLRSWRFRFAWRP